MTEDGDVAIVDVGSGAVRRIPTSVSAAGGIALSREGGAVAFAERTSKASTNVFVADLEQSQFAMIQPNTGGVPPHSRWMIGGWLVYGAWDGSDLRTYVVAPNASIGDPLPNGARHIVTTDARAILAYARCDAMTNGVCLGPIVFQSFDGQVTAVSADTVAATAVEFSPSGEWLAVREQVDGIGRLRLHRSDGREVRDLAPHDLTSSDPNQPLLAIPSGGSLWSPDGSEVLAVQDGALVAVSLHNGGSRRVAESVHVAGFTPSGELLFEVNSDVSAPGSDVEDRRFMVYVDETPSPRIVHDAVNAPVYGISPRGQYVWCGRNPTMIASVETGERLFTSELGWVAGFDLGDLGGILVRPDFVVPGQFEVSYVEVPSLTERLLGTGMRHGAAELPPHDPAMHYSPTATFAID